MGYRPPPPPPEYGGDCFRFAPGTTPKRFIVSFSGIEFCRHLWEEGMEPPTMDLVVEQRIGAACVWDWTSGFWDVIYDLRNPNWSVLNFTWKDNWYIFEGIMPNLDFGFQNKAEACQVGLYLGYDGAGHVFARAETTAPSLSKMCVLAGIPDDIDTKCDFYPLDKDTGWMRFFREDTRIKSRMKYTLDETF